MTDRLLHSPARERLEWILAGLDAGTSSGADGAPSWGADVTEVLAPAFLRAIPPATFLDRIRQRSRRYSPFVLVGIDITETTAQARLRDRDGQIQVLHCAVEPDPPHRIDMTWMTGWVPEGMTARLPEDFTGHELPGTERPVQLIVVSGVPGTGKSSLADAIGRELQIPVFAVDWLLGALTPFGGRHLPDLWGIGYEQLTTLAYRQLQLGQSVILDAPVEEPGVRDRWRSLAAWAGIHLSVIMCACSDPLLHRERLEGRDRGIPGWHDAGDWNNVQRRLAAFPPWEQDVLQIDAVQPFEQNLAVALKYLG